MTSAVDIITNSQLKTFHACQRLHHLQYRLGFRSAVDDPTAAFGNVFHAGLEAWWRAHQVDDNALANAQEAIAARAHEIDAVALAKAELLIVAYDLRWSPAMADLQVMAVESPFNAPMRTLTGRFAKRMRVAGKIDAVVKRHSDRSIWLVEHKTTGADLSPGSTYWQRLRMDSQVSLYFDGAAANGYAPVAGCIYDVVSRPEQRPHAATPADKRKYTKDGRLYANQREADETMDQFKERMAEAIAADPMAYLQRIDVVRLDTEIEAARRDVYEAAQLIRVTGRTGQAPRNVDACLKFGGGRPCAFFDVCCGHADLDDNPAFKRLVDVHPELST